MSRFGLTLSGGEKIIVDSPSSAMQDFRADVSAADFLMLTDIRGGDASVTHEVIVAGRQGSTFRPKR
jgi:hypothetical protein